MQRRVQKIEKRSARRDKNAEPQRFGALYVIFGGAERDRTADLLVANEALSQLSYSPPPDGTCSTLAGTSTASNDSCECIRNPLGASNKDLYLSVHATCHGSSRRQRLLHLQPYLFALCHCPQYRNHEPRAASRNCLQRAFIPSAKLRPVQQHLPPLPPFNATLLANIHHHSRKAHETAAPARVVASASISRLLPTHKGVLW